MDGSLFYVNLFEGPMQRSALFDQLLATDVYDLAIVGGGATGLGVALDAATR